nr:hypothetical protein [Arthrobacter hankyongi]
MNHTLAQIGIGERLGVLKDYPTKWSAGAAGPETVRPLDRLVLGA